MYHDEESESQMLETFASMACIAEKHTKAADKRFDSDTESGNSGGAFQESQLALQWIKEWLEISSCV